MLKQELAKNRNAPRGMVPIEETDPSPYLCAPLSDNFADSSGIRDQSWGRRGYCTLGFNAVLNGVNGFVTTTSSHHHQMLI